MKCIWRWDQGRLEYLRFNNLRKIAYALVQLEGVELNSGGADPLRSVLEAFTDLPFSPNNYKVWRNYKRVFECSLLATNLSGRLFVSDICRKLALIDDEIIDVDEYLVMLTQHYRYPFPAFESHGNYIDPTYPFCAILKFLVCRCRFHSQNGISVSEIFSYLIGNQATGIEGLDHYAFLQPTEYSGTGDEIRQVREMVVVLSQFSFLKWESGELRLDTSLDNLEIVSTIVNIASPILTLPNSDREVDFLAITSINSSNGKRFEVPLLEENSESLFVEGKRIRMTHIRAERSPILRKIFFERNPGVVCEMCQCDTHLRYPWTINLLELHHLLPLMSALTVTLKGTSLADVVGLCPTCHRSIHIYYKNWLNSHNLIDFTSKDEAREIYHQAKTEIVI